MPFDRRKSLQDLDGEDWGKPDYDSHLVKECHRLRRVKVRDLTVENLRMLIGQNIGLQYLIPMALERLRENPFAEGDCYPGDLLANVLRAEPRFWKERPELREQVSTIVERAISLFPTVPEVATKTVTRTLRGAYEDFQRGQARS